MLRKIDVEQGSLDWHILRQGRVTGTTLKSAIGSPKVQETLMHKLIAEMMTEPQIDDINSAAVTRGREIEPLARAAVIAETGIPFTETGMLVCDELPGFGVSPDAIFEDSGLIRGGLEIKCPDSKKHVEYLRAGVLPSEYDQQVMAPFILSDDITHWYFASYDDRNYQLPLFLIRIERDQFPDIEKHREKLRAFIRRVHETHEELTF